MELVPEPQAQPASLWSFLTLRRRSLLLRGVVWSVLGTIWIRGCFEDLTESEFQTYLRMWLIPVFMLSSGSLFGFLFYGVRVKLLGHSNRLVQLYDFTVHVATCAAILAGMALGGWLSHDQRQAALVARGRELVGVLADYHARHGTYPRRASDLPRDLLSPGFSRYFFSRVGPPGLEFRSGGRQVVGTVESWPEQEAERERVARLALTASGRTPGQLEVVGGTVNPVIHDGERRYYLEETELVVFTGYELESSALGGRYDLASDSWR